MNLTIRHFSGIESADLDFDRIAVVCGPNAAGKTTIARALGALLTGEPIPIPGLRKQDSAMLLRGGGAKSEIALADEEGTSRIAYPAAKLSTEGSPLSATRVACGLDSIATMEPKVRADYLARLLGTEPDKDALASACEPLGLKPEHIDKLWELVSTAGWDGAHAQTKQTGVTLKGQWEERTGERYGSNKAEGWLPEYWATDLEAASEDSLKAAVVEAQEFAEAAVASKAVDESERARLEESARLVPVLQGRAENARRSMNSVGEELKSVAAETTARSKPVQPCPECGAKLAVVDGRIVHQPQGGGDAPEIKELEARVVNLQKAYESHAEGVRQHERDLAVAEQAAKDLADLNDPREATSAEQVNRTRDERDRVERRLAAFQTKRRADSLHASITKNVAIQALLAPDGLRQQALGKALAKANKGLADWSAAAKWASCEIADDLTVTYGGRHYMLCSKSEQLRARVLLQVVCALADDSDALVIDEADMLDQGGRNGLLTLLMGVDLPTLVCMTLVDRKGFPAREEAAALATALAAKKVGGVWWVEDGKAEVLHG